MLELTSKMHGDDSDHLIQVYTDLGRAEQIGAAEDPSNHSHEKAIEHFLHAHSIASTKLAIYSRGDTHVHKFR